jgi:hypothetical protein
VREKLPEFRENFPEFREKLPHAVFEKKQAGFRPPLTRHRSRGRCPLHPRWKAEGLPDPPLRGAGGRRRFQLHTFTFLLAEKTICVIMSNRTL